MEEEIVRDYEGPDYYLMEHSQLLKDLLADDLADFSVFDTEYDAAFVTAWQQAVDNAVNYTDDSVISGQIATQTQTVDQATKACQDLYHDMIYFAGKAFGKRSPILKEFGKGQPYRKANSTTERMFEFIDELNTTSLKYRTQLEGAGCPPATIDGIPDKRDALNNSNREQNLTIKGRPVISQGRVLVYNALYKITRQTIDAAQRVYRNNPAKRNQYQYNPPINENEPIILEGNIGVGGAPVVVTTSTDWETDTPLLLKSINTPLRIFYAQTPNTGPNPGDPFADVPANDQVPATAGDIGYNGTRVYLSVINTGVVPGSYRIEVG